MSNAMDTDPRGPGMSGRQLCQKRAYGTQEAALKNAQNILYNFDGFRGDAVRAYRCPDCKKWHLSTKGRGGVTEWVTRKVSK